MNKWKAIPTNSSQIPRRRMQVSDESSTSSAGVRRGLTCHICTSVVSPPTQSRDIEKLNRMIKNLCARKILGLGTLAGANLHLCGGCEANVKRLWELQSQRDTIDLKMSNILNGIEKKVMDSEARKKVALKLSPPPASGTSFSLRESLLEEGAKGRDDATSAEEDEEIMEIIPVSSIPYGSSSSESCWRSSPGIGSSRNAQRVLVYSNDKEGDVEDAFSPADDDKNEEELMEFDFKSQRAISTNQKLFLVEKKQEIRVDPLPESEVEEDDEDSEEDEEEGESEDDDDIFTIEPCKQKFIFQGVEIFTCLGSKQNLKYLQCGSCSHTLAFSNGATGKTSAVVKMKFHINSTHTNLSLQKRKKVYSAKKKEATPISLDCDICGRAIKGTAMNLLWHKFTHKNDNERRSALAAKEPGSRNMFLERKRSPCGTEGKKLLLNKKKKAKQPQYESTFRCRFCQRIFQRNNSLRLHLRVHQNEVDQRSRARHMSPPLPPMTFEPGSVEEFIDALGLVRAKENGNDSGANGGESDGSTSVFRVVGN